MAALPNRPALPPNAIAPPLPPGWTEHVAPGGQSYYYNAASGESTYIRPLPAFPIPPFPAGVVPAQSTLPPEKKKQKKEKAKLKTPIPGTAWLRVTTTAGNVFYTNTERKESVWSIPEEIGDAVAKLEEEEKAREAEEAALKASDDHSQDVTAETSTRDAAGVEAKRKAAEEPEPLDEVVSKKPRIEDADDQDEDEEDEDEEPEEEWQKEAAAQLAAEAEEEERRRKEEEKQKLEEQEELKRKEKEKGAPVINMPNRVDLSIEEAKALFKTLLREKDINPLLPWDTALPQFISDPRYVLLPSVTARRDAFDEYCRDRARELRQAKVSAQTSGTAEEKKDPKEVFDKLLHDEVTSTRTSWTEWRRTWKKDRRFWGWGRDDREREKRFRDYLKQLGEQKRKAAQKAEADFFALLKEKAKVSKSSSWKDVKKGLDKDPRYDAVGSSSLREELFNTYLKSLAEGTRSPPATMNNKEGAEDTAEERKRKDKERKERAVRERREQVQREQKRVETDLARSRRNLTREEGELQFLTLLTDAVREPTATWESSLDELKIDPRFDQSTLPARQQQALFHRHVAALRAKHVSALHALFAAHAPALDTPFSELPLTSIQTSLPAAKLHYDAENDKNGDGRALEQEYRSWRNQRTEKAEKEFQDMLHENAFVEFWGRIRKIKEGAEGGNGMKVAVGSEDLAGEEDNEEGEKADLKSLARNIDVKEIERVLKNDKRYTIFDHIPEERERWIRAHIEKLAAPKLSVHIGEQAR